MAERTCRCNCGTAIPQFRVYAKNHNPGSKGRWRNHDPKVPSRNCLECDAPLVSAKAWRAMSLRERYGKARHGGRQLCSRCFKAAARGQTALGARAPQRSREEVLVEWELLRSDGVTDLTVAARRMGMTKAGLQKALERARAAGDDRGKVHRNQDLGGLSPQRMAPRPGGMR